MNFWREKEFYLVLLLCLATVATAADSGIKVGMAESELLELRDEPAGKMSAGSKTIYKWVDLEVWVQDEKISKIKKIEPQSDEVRRLQALKQARATVQRDEAQRARAQYIGRQQSVQNIKHAEDRASQANVSALVQAEVERWKVTKDAVARKGYKYGSQHEWNNLYNQYIAAYKKEKEAIFDGNSRQERAYSQSRSRLELQLNKLTDEKLNNDDTIDIRQEHYSR
jgi:hypothetical protein